MIPLTISVTISMIMLSVSYYKQIEIETNAEAQSIVYANKNRELWSFKINDFNNVSTKMIAINSAKEILLIDYLIDTTKEIKEMLPILENIKGEFSK